MNKLLTWEIIGIVFIVFLGSFMHFTYELSGENVIVGAFSAVNESTWEHLKLAVFPALLFMLIEFKFMPKPKNFFCAKAAGIWLMPLLIIAFFYAYTAIIPGNFVMDISIFVLAVVIGQIVSYKMMTFGKDYERFANASIASLFALAFFFVFFTFFPPEVFLFQDPTTGGYGIWPLVLVD